LRQQSRFESLAVLLIDMQDGFLDSLEKKLLVPNQIQVLKFCKEKEIPVMVFEYKRFGRTTSSLVMELKNIPRKNVYWFEKTDNDAFSVSDFYFLLKRKKITKLLLMGINAAFCVFDTAKTAIRVGFTIMTSEDLIAGYKDEDGRFRAVCQDFSWFEANGIAKHDHKNIIKRLNGS